MNDNKIKKLYNEYKNKVWLFFFTQAIVPFDTVIAFYCAYGGVSALFKLGTASDRFETVLGQSLALVFNVWYALAGLLMFFAIGLRRRDLQKFALISIITSLLIRIVAISWLSGWDSQIFNLYIINSAFIVACLTRIYMLSKYDFVLKLLPGRVNDGQ
jgi:hypothetical protein